MQQNMSKNRRLSQTISYIILTAGSIAMLFPFFWMISTSFKPAAEVYSMNLIPTNPTLDNYREVFFKTKFFMWFVNSIFIAAVTTVTTIFFGAITGYVLAKMDFPAKDFIFIMILSSLMIPTEMLIIPWYVTAVKMHWVNTYWGIMFPGVITAFGVFLMKQFMEGIPTDLLDAARIDGLGEFAIFWKIALPQVRSAIAALGIFTFLGNWNAFLWPVIAVDDPLMRTLPVGISLFSTENANAWHLSMTAASVALIPVLIVFIIFQKQIIEGITITGMKS